MDTPQIFEEASLWRLGQGAIGGAVLLAAIGFGWGGWHTNFQAKEIARNAADDAVLSVLMPVCVDSFAGKATPEQWVGLRAAQSYDRGTLVEAVVKIPGKDSLGYTLSARCADILVAKKEKSAQN